MHATSLVWLVVAVNVVVTVQGQTNYCTLCADHTMCKFKGDGSACGTKSASGLDSAAQAAVLAAHNKYRRVVAKGQLMPKQPAAADMMLMTWDTELATIAQRWADQCNFAHDTCRKVVRFRVGQNIYMSSGSKATPVEGWNNAVDAWYNEVATFPSSYISPFQMGSGTGHYTQVVWASSKTLGCGYAAYKSTQLFVCNYGPGGNMLKDTMYTVGPACSKCPAGTTCSDALCA